MLMKNSWIRLALSVYGLYRCAAGNAQNPQRNRGENAVKTHKTRGAMCLCRERLTPIH